MTWTHKLSAQQVVADNIKLGGTIDMLKGTGTLEVDLDSGEC